MCCNLHIAYFTFVILTLSLPLPTASQNAFPAQTLSPYHITVTPLDRQAYSGYNFRVRLRVTNSSPVPQSFAAFSCSWIDNWQERPSQPLEKSHIVLDRTCICGANALQTITLKPGETYEKQAQMCAWSDKKGHKFFIHFQVGFTTQPKPMFDRADREPQSPFYWSDEAVMEIVK